MQASLEEVFLTTTSLDADHAPAATGQAASGAAVGEAPSLELTLLPAGLDLGLGAGSSSMAPGPAAWALDPGGVGGARSAPLGYSELEAGPPEAEPPGSPQHSGYVPPVPTVDAPKQRPEQQPVGTLAHASRCLSWMLHKRALAARRDVKVRSLLLPAAQPPTAHLHALATAAGCRACCTCLRCPSSRWPSLLWSCWSTLTPQAPRCSSACTPWSKSRLSPWHTTQRPASWQAAWGPSTLCPTPALASELLVPARILHSSA
jgi:hypothetical protein